MKLTAALLKLRTGQAEAALEMVEADDGVRARPPLWQLILALALSDLDQRVAGVAALGAAAARTDNRHAAASSRELWISGILRREAESKLLPHLDAFVRGEYWPSTRDERLALIATSEDRGMPFARARLIADAFAEDPTLARDLSTGLRYRGACAAAACGIGRPADRPAITPEEQASWRARSLGWLRDELSAIRQEASPQYRSALLSEWLNDGELRGLRDPAQLATLPPAERLALEALWADVIAALANRPD